MSPSLITGLYLLHSYDIDFLKFKSFQLYWTCKYKLVQIKENVSTMLSFVPDTMFWNLQISTSKQLISNKIMYIYLLDGYKTGLTSLNSNHSNGLSLNSWKDQANSYRSIYFKRRGKVCKQTKWPHFSSLVSVAWSDYEYFYSALDGMLVHCRVTLNIKSVLIHTPG